MDYAENGGVAYTPENINKQLLSGASREQLAKLFGHKSWKTLDMYMRRKNYAWNGDKQVYEIKAKKPKEEDFTEEQTGSKRVRQILKSFKEGKDAKRIAKELGFKNHLILAEYMKDNGYQWSSDKLCYDYVEGSTSVPEVMKKDDESITYDYDQDTFSFIMENKNRIMELLEGDSSKELPRYNISGYKINKCVQLSHKLDLLLKDFCEDYNISQREIFEIGLVETLKRYGYEAEIKGVFGNY